ncbi:MAG: glucose 1-dehydrogenase [Acidimicrobiia bacterium]|nr:glucose 1-dehydrogenase [Acidimicrobiia bacterium]MYE74156.1 glucose 1-dehydrogenase [Acidimicrobiia bacterium]MYJ61646.1 glucose 1-dehydrogenase [Acidimicrobiia bacterium]
MADSPAADSTTDPRFAPRPDSTSLDAAQMFDLSGRVAIVTGGSRGIGLSIAHGFAAQGAKVVVASRKADACDLAVAEITEAGGEALAVPVHMGDLDSVNQLVDATLEQYGQIDILVNNAANPLGLPMEDITPEAWESSFTVNLRGPFFLFQRCLPSLLDSDHASVINVISVGAYIPAANTAMYGAAKAGLLSFTRSMAGVYSPQGIRVNAIAPGTVDTTMTRNTGPEAMGRMADLSHIGRIGHPDELVGTALLLASDAGSYITGQCIIVDGGFVPAR